MIELSKVSKTVLSGSAPLTILHELDLTVPAGQFVSISGPSGSGKSTLLGLVAGLDAPTAGEIRIAGENITQMSEDKLADLRNRRIGFVFQSFHLIPALTALENVMIPMEIAGVRGARARAGELLRQVELAERAHHYPAQLSGGEQQRVAIARAFANRPPLLLADEPTGNLDQRTGEVVFRLMLDLNEREGTTLVLVTHDAELARRAARRITLRDGRIVEDVTDGRSDENGRATVADELSDRLEEVARS